MNQRKVGTKQEELAASYLQTHGMKLVEHNFRSHRGEIDLIGYHKGYLVFTEVKYRRSREYGTPEQAVDARKQTVICKVADYYRYTHHINEFQAVRYDVVAIFNDELTWYQNAFLHRGSEHRWSR